jgi:predicted homoserine dehydrogenase-like protein
MSYGRQNVDSTLLSPHLTVIITPGTPGRDARFDSEAMTEIKHVVLMSVNVNDTTVVQPFEVRQEPVVYSNRFGASVTMIRAIAKFCLTDVPSTNFNIIGITNLGPRQPAGFLIDEKNRKLIR